MENDVNLASVGENWYAQHTGQDHITIYRSVMGEPAWVTAFDGSSTTVSNQKVHGQLLAFQDYHNLYLFHADTHEMIWSTPYDQQRLLGFSKDGTKLWYADGKETLVAVDTATGQTEAQAITVDAQGAEVSIRGTFFLEDDCLYYVVGGLETPLLTAWNLKTNEKNTCPLAFDTEEDIMYWSWEAIAAKDGYVWLWGHEKVCLEANLQTGAVRCLDTETDSRPVVAVTEDGSKAAVTVGAAVCIQTPGQDDSKLIRLENANPGSLHYQGDILFVLCDNGYLYRLNRDGDCLSQTRLEVSAEFAQQLLSSSADYSRIRWHFTADNQLILNAMGTGNVIDCETWSVRTSIGDFLMYDEENNALICQLTDGVGAYPVYETRQLLEMAADALKDFHLTQEQKTAYGIQ